MALKVRWSPEAVEDLEAIAEYIARDSQYYARAVVTKILSVARSICKFPNLGRIVPEIGEVHIRERLVYSYRLVYRIESGRILIIAIIHGNRLLENVAERFDPNS